ncbi:amidase domain-containing protein [Streptomyces sp. NBC_00335]|uniref:amidase domain-containing protein n=1 Tax=unclassified Streptomyces TaxID=2593676 RepID=UPI00225181BD|nr:MULTISPECIES: amidase domain-containing protein [unclassified Streptomyces]MCX5409864.1 amidase domain-containing protein [Streptomyces sp. NBC_00086]
MIRKVAALTLVVLVALVTLGGLQTPAQAAGVPDRVVTRLDLATYVVNYKNGMPSTEDTNQFRWEADSPAEVAEIIRAMRIANQGDAATRGEAEAILQRYGYNLDWIQDTVSERSYLVVRESVPCQRCWGMYILRYDTSSAQVNLAVEVPHPFHDENTPELGIKMFRDVDAKMFAMAGTHRYNSTETRPEYENSRVSDMARSYESLFHKVHTNFTTSAPNATHVVQLHGFEERANYPDVVLSNGTPEPEMRLDSFSKALNANDVWAGVFDGVHYPDLGATINPQAKHTNGKGGFFYHMEMTQWVRYSTTKHTAVIEALKDAMFAGRPGEVADIPYAPGYNPSAAVAYAVKYAKIENPAYKDFANLGGDCTNFVSQALLAGGWKMNVPLVSHPNTHRERPYWYYRANDVSWTWSAANNWAEFAKDSGRVEKVRYLSDVGIGDIVQFANPADRNKDHTMIVTSLSEQGPRMSYHSTGRPTNKLDEPLWDIVNRHRDKAFYAWRVVNTTATPPLS